MDFHNPTVVSKKLQSEAETLVFQNGLDSILKKYGEIFYTGSFYLDLMIWSDIDIQVLFEPEEFDIEKFINIGKDIAKKFDVIEMKFKNHVAHKAFQLPEGLYWNIKIKRPGEKLPWKIDLWALNNNDFHEKKTKIQKFKSKLNNLNRQLILDTKYSLLNKDGRTPILSGYYIYEAVLDKQIYKINEIIEYLTNRGIKIENSEKRFDF